MRVGVLIGVLTLAMSKLPALDIDMDSITMLRISSGGFFSVQFAIAYSRLVRGSVIFAAGPYYCSKGNLDTAQIACEQQIEQLKPK